MWLKFCDTLYGVKPELIIDFFSQIDALLDPGNEDAGEDAGEDTDMEVEDEPEESDNHK